MKPQDIIVIAVLAVAVFFAYKKFRKGGSCCGDCSKCKTDCQSRRDKDK